MMIARILFPAFGLVLCALPAAAQSDRVVALVVSVGEGSARADAVQAGLQLIGAETLRSTDPSNAELRSMLRRFADESADARATFVYLDMPAIAFEGREYVLPHSTELQSYSGGLDTPTDLFTKAIPLLAFARTAAQAEQGGAVVITVSASPDGLPDGVTQVEAAPDPVQGASPIMVAGQESSGPILQVIAAAGRDEVVETGSMLRRMVVHEGVTLSALPSSPIFLKSPPQLEVEPQPVIAPLPNVQVKDAEIPETLEELAILEQSLSRSAKRALQRVLRDLTLYRGLVDGIFGPQTRAAIIAFQTSRSEEPTGVLSRRQMLDLRLSS